MNLTEMFYGSFVPPKVTSIRVHRLGFANLPKYIEPKNKKVADNRTFEEKMSEAAKKVLFILRAQKKPITCQEMSMKTPFSHNYCGGILSTFVKEGLAKRIKVKKPNTRLYVYIAVKND